MINETHIKTKAWQEEEALKRFQIISPLLDYSIDEAKKAQIRNQLASKHELSTRTLFRYEAAYKKEGFPGLKPMERGKELSQSKRLPKGFDKILEEAIQLKREVPSRSINQIIMILEMEGLAVPGTLKRSTLQDHLYNAGFGKKQMKKYADARNSSTKRFCMPNRMMLTQSDIKYALKLPIGSDGKLVQTYLVAIIDDHSKVILASGFYDHQEQSIVEDTYRKAILNFGTFDKTLVDNGKQFVSKELIDALSRLGIRHRRCKINSAQSKGKIESYNRFANAFLAEAKAQKIKTLAELNHFWNIWVEEYYHNKPHDGIKEYYESHGVPVPEEGISPMQEFKRDSRPLKFLDSTLVAQAFLHHAKREVDKGACISLKGRKYEVHASLIGASVDVSYDPMDLDIITISHPGVKSFSVKPLRIGAYCDPTPEIPLSMLPKEPENSRLLLGLEKRHKESLKVKANAISFNSYRKEGESNV
jgi:transposase InsO family protein